MQQSIRDAAQKCDNGDAGALAHARRILEKKIGAPLTQPTTRGARTWAPDIDSIEVLPLVERFDVEPFSDFQPNERTL